MMLKGTDDNNEADDWHVECLDPRLEERVKLLSHSRGGSAEGKDAEEERGAERFDGQRVNITDGGSDDVRDGYRSWRTGASCCKPRIYVVMVSAMAALGGVLFGYDTGIISGAILQLNDEFQLSCQQTEIVISSMMMGAVAASLCGGFIVDWLGRRTTIIANDVVFLTATIILSSASSYTGLVIGRLIIGFAVSLSAIAECVYITEISPPCRRGFLVSLNELGITFGFLTAYVLNFSFIKVQGGWRYMFAFGAIPAIVQGFGMYFLPKSPRYLVIKGQQQQAKQVLRRLMEEDEDVEGEFSRIQASIAEEKHMKTWDFCCGGRNNIWPALLISVTLVILQQISGQPSVLLYAPIIFREVGLSSDAASVLATVGLGLVKFLVTAFYLVIVDKMGRRCLLMVGAGVMMFSLLGLAVLIGTLFPDSHIASSCGDLDLHQLSTNPSPVTTTASQHTADLKETTPAPPFSNSSPATWVALVIVFFYVAGYSFGFGPGTWLVMSEIFPSSVKGRAIALATAINWTAQMVTSLTFLDAIVAVGTSWMFVGYSVVCAVAVVFVFFIVPETKGKSLEVITSDLVSMSDFCRCRRSICAQTKGPYTTLCFLGRLQKST